MAETNDPPEVAITRNCPFYGMRLVMLRSEKPLLLASRGNQCGVIMDAFSPCRLEIEKKTVDWRTCPVLADRIRFREEKGTTGA